jgi:hypothetical protein
MRARILLFLIVCLLALAAARAQYHVGGSAAGALASNASPYVHLTWTASTSVVPGHGGQVKVYRATGACSGSPTFSILTSDALDAGPYDDHTVTAGHTYCYYVTEFQDGLESFASSTVEATT